MHAWGAAKLGRKSLSVGMVILCSGSTPRQHYMEPTRFGSRNVKRNKHFATKRTSAVLIDYRTDGNVSHTTRNGRQPLTLTKLLKCCRTSIMLRNYRSQKRLEEATKLRRVLRSRTLVSKHFADAPPSLPPFLFGTCGSADGR